MPERREAAHHHLDSWPLRAACGQTVDPLDTVPPSCMACRNEIAQMHETKNEVPNTLMRKPATANERKNVCLQDGASGRRVAEIVTWPAKRMQTCVSVRRKSTQPTVKKYVGSAVP